MMNDPTPLGPHEPRAVQAPAVTLALKDLNKDPKGPFLDPRDPSRDLPPNLDPD